MSKFDDISKIANDVSAKKVQLENAVRSGQFKKQMKPGLGDSKEGVKSFDSDSSSDYADEKEDEVGRLNQSITIVRKKVSDSNIKINNNMRKSMVTK